MTSRFDLLSPDVDCSLTHSCTGRSATDAALLARGSTTVSRLSPLQLVEVVMADPIIVREPRNTIRWLLTGVARSVLAAVVAFTGAHAPAWAFTVTACAPEIPGEGGCWNIPGPSSLKLVGPLPSQDAIEGEALGIYEVVFHDIVPGDYVLKAIGCNPFGCLVNTPVSVVDHDVFVIADMVAAPPPTPTCACGQPRAACRTQGGDVGVCTRFPDHGCFCFYDVTPSASPTRPSPTPTQTPPSSSCVGDCSGDSIVTIDEIIKLVFWALNGVGVNEQLMCPDLSNWCDSELGIAIDCIIQAVNNALNGCPVSATPTPTPACFEPFPTCCDLLPQGCFSVNDQSSIADCFAAAGYLHGCYDPRTFCDVATGQCVQPPTPGPTSTPTDHCGLVCTDARCLVAGSGEIGRCDVGDANGCHCIPLDCGQSLEVTPLIVDFGDVPVGDVANAVLAVSSEKGASFNFAIDPSPPYFLYNNARSSSFYVWPYGSYGPPWLSVVDLGIHCAPNDLGRVEGLLTATSSDCTAVVLTCNGIPKSTPTPTATGTTPTPTSTPTCAASPERTCSPGEYQCASDRNGCEVCDCCVEPLGCCDFQGQRPCYSILQPDEMGVCLNIHHGTPRGCPLPVVCNHFTGQCELH